MSVGFPTCPTCGGSGTKQTLSGIVNDMTGRNWPEVRPCPGCVRGSVITDELVEAGAKALAEYRGDPVYSECSKPWSVHDEEATRAVLAAVVTHIKEGTE